MLQSVAANHGALPETLQNDVKRDVMKNDDDDDDDDDDVQWFNVHLKVSWLESSLAHSATVKSDDLPEKISQYWHASIVQWLTQSL